MQSETMKLNKRASYEWKKIYECREILGNLYESGQSLSSELMLEVNAACNKHIEKLLEIKKEMEMLHNIILFIPEVIIECEDYSTFCE